MIRAFTAAASASLPPGVTLQEIDGGPTYYADNGYTFATASFTINGVTYAGWDDPKWLSIGTFLDKMANTTHRDRWIELGLNTGIAVQGDADLAMMNTAGLQLIIQSDEWLNDHTNNIFHATLRANVAGIYMPDEPGTLAVAYGNLETFPCSGTPVGNTGQTGRFFATTMQHSQVSFFDIEGTDVDDVMASVRTTPCSTRTLGFVGVDQYFFNGGFGTHQVGGMTVVAGVDWPENASRIFNRTGRMPADLMQRGVRYADLAKFIRLGNSNFSPAHASFKAPAAGHPAYVFVETGTSYAENTNEGSAIRVTQLNAAVWGSLIGGARFVTYFSNGDAGGWTSESPVEDKAFWDTIYNGDARSIYDQLTLTNGQVMALAPVINSPNAVGYLSMSPAEQVLTSSTMESGYATLVKYRNRSDDVGADNKFYILAIPRYGNRTHNNAGVDTGAESWPKTATFMIKNTGATQVTVLDEARTIPITAGGTQFQDSFSGPTDVHRYRID